MSKGAGVSTRMQMPAQMARGAELFSCCCAGSLFPAHMKAVIPTPTGTPRKKKAALREASPPSKVPIGKVKRKKEKVLENGNGFSPAGNASLHSGVPGQSLPLFSFQAYKVQVRAMEDCSACNVAECVRRGKMSMRELARSGPAKRSKAGATATPTAVCSCSRTGSRKCQEGQTQSRGG